MMDIDPSNNPISWVTAAIAAVAGGALTFSRLRKSITQDQRTVAEENAGMAVVNLLRDELSRMRKQNDDMQNQNTVLAAKVRELQLSIIQLHSDISALTRKLGSLR